MLVKDARLRPSISSVIKRFDHVYALVTVAGPPYQMIKSNKPYMSESTLLEYLFESVDGLQLRHEYIMNRATPNELKNQKEIQKVTENIYY